jgi:hypothetical protein
MDCATARNPLTVVLAGKQALLTPAELIELTGYRRKSQRRLALGRMNSHFARALPMAIRWWIAPCSSIILLRRLPGENPPDGVNHDGTSCQRDGLKPVRRRCLVSGTQPAIGR